MPKQRNFFYLISIHPMRDLDIIAHMPEMFEKFLLAWIPLFVAMDPLGLIPIFISLTRGIEKPKLKVITYQALITATVVAVGFVFLGKAIFQSLGITVYDFQIAGGLILFGLAVKDLFVEENMEALKGRDVGVVPLGLPLIAGPATLTSLLILGDTIGLMYTLMAFFVNVFLILIVFLNSHHFQRIIGKTGLKALSKIISLLLAAIAVNMIRLGFQKLL